MFGFLLRMKSVLPNVTDTVILHRRKRIQIQIYDRQQMNVYLFKKNFSKLTETIGLNHRVKLILYKTIPLLSFCYAEAYLSSLRRKRKKNTLKNCYIVVKIIKEELNFESINYFKITIQTGSSYIKKATLKA